MKISGMIVFLLAAFSCLSNAVNSAYSENSVTYDSLPVVEKVCLHIDRDYYFPGDDIWFKAYLIEASDRQLSGFSRTCMSNLFPLLQKSLIVAL